MPARDSMQPTDLKTATDFLKNIFEGENNIEQLTGTVNFLAIAVLLQTILAFLTVIVLICTFTLGGICHLVGALITFCFCEAPCYAYKAAHRLARTQRPNEEG